MSGFRFLGEPLVSRWMGHPLGTLQQAGAALDIVRTSLTLDLDSRTDVYQTAGGVVSGNGDPVGSWLDQSGNSHDVAQVAGGERPLYETNQINGLPSLTFDGVDDYFSDGPNNNVIFTAGAKTFYAVVNPTSFNTDNATPYQNELVLGGGGAFFDFCHFRSTGPVVGHYNWDGNTDVVTTSTSTGWQIVYGRHDGINITISVDGGAESNTASGNTTNMGGVAKIGFLSGAGYLTGKLARVICYNVAHDAAQKAQNLAYLSSLYGISV